MMIFFFQAEDGIRDGHVTGVQTCALPIFYREIRKPDEALDWRGQAFGLALQHWELYARHPWILQSNLVRLALGPHYLDASEYLYAAPEQLNLSPEDIVQSAKLLDSYVRGAARGALLAQQATTATGVSHDEFSAARKEIWNTYFDLDRYPSHTRLRTCGGLNDPRDPFEASLNRPPDGIAQLSGEQASPT